MQIKVYECYIKQLKPRESLLQIDDSSEEEVEEKFSDDETTDEEDEDHKRLMKELTISDTEYD